ncbi:MAG: autotransporter domain-containing protein [Chlorobi bacterium]|nr:autotransporter domain-containing protein [Chlorobiota bacterium]
MTVMDNSLISGVPVLSGGAGYDELYFDSWSGELGASVVNWEMTTVMSGSAVGLGAPKALDGDMHIERGSAVSVSAAGGRYSLGGTLVNNGLLDLRNGSTSDRFRIEGDYAGTGALGLDIAPGSSDLFLIAGDAEGSTALLLRAEGSVASLRDGGPLLLAHVDGTSMENAFVMQSAEGYGPYSMELVMEAAPSGGYDWYLGIGGYLPEAVALQALMPFIGQPLSGTLPRFGERLASSGYCRASHESGAFWSRAFGSRYRTEFSGDVASHVSGYSGGVQAGADLYAGKNGDVSSAAGLYAGAGFQQGDAPEADGRKAAGLEGSFVHAGAYATLAVPGSYYVEWILQAGFHDIALSYASGGRDDAETWSWLASMEAGLRIPLGGALSFEPKAQVIYRHTGGFSLSPAATGEVWVDTLQGIRALLGAGLTFSECGGFNGFFGMDLIGDFDTKNRVRYLDTDVALKSESEWCFLGLSAGIGRKSRTGGPDYYLRAGAMYGLETGSSFGYTIAGGLRVPI